jgi:hypothetical protein
MMDSRLRCHMSLLERALEAAPVGETSPVMRGNTKGGLEILTEGFGSKLDGGNGLVAVDSGGSDFCSVRDGLEHGEAILGAAQGVVVSYGARGAFYRPRRRAEGSGGGPVAVEFNSNGFSNEAARGVDETLS